MSDVWKKVEKAHSNYVAMTIGSIMVIIVFGGMAFSQAQKEDQRREANAAEIDHLFEDLLEMQRDLRATELRLEKKMDLNSYAYEEGWDDAEEMMGDPPYEEGC